MNKLKSLGLVIPFLGACAFNSTPVYKQNDTLMDGDSAEQIEKLYGTYKVVDVMETAYRSAKTIAVVKIAKENGKPVFRFYGKDGQEWPAISPKQCSAERPVDRNRLGIACDDHHSFLDYYAGQPFRNPIIRVSNHPGVQGIKQAFPSTDRALAVHEGEYSMYVSYGHPYAQFELKRFEATPQ